MRRRRRAWVVAASGVFLLTAGLLHVGLWRPLAVIGDPPADGYSRVAGVVHVHTTFSDGGGTAGEVIAAARASGLAFVSINDHNDLGAKPLEGYQQGVLVLVGAEISTPSGHVLGLGLDRDPPYRFSGDGLDGLEDVRDLGGVAFAAHPLSARGDLRWTGWDLPGPWGIEVLNGDSEWRRAGPRLLLTAGLYRLNPRYALLQSLRPLDDILHRWDVMLARRDVVGLSAADAHSRVPITKTRALRFPSYQSLFDLSRVHLLLERPLSDAPGPDRMAVKDALARGRFYMGLDALAPADAVGFTVESGTRRWTMGESAPVVEGARVRAQGRMPKGTRVVLLRDGKRIADTAGALDVSLPGPGVYRLEAHVPGWAVPWVITNPIYVFDPATQEARRVAAAWPGPPQPKAVRPLSALPGSAAFGAEFDPLSWMDPSVGAVGVGPDGGEVWRLAFRLGAPTSRQPFTWCALVNRQARDLGAYQGLRFLIKGDGEYRIWVQLRDPNPASADAGLEWWLASARSSSEWREVLLPFSRFRTINRKTDGRLDAAETRAIVFVLDGASVKVGTGGTIWIADVGVYQ